MVHFSHSLNFLISYDTFPLMWNSFWYFVGYETLNISPLSYLWHPDPLHYNCFSERLSILLRRWLYHVIKGLIVLRDLSAKCPFVIWIQVGSKVSLRVWDSSCRQNVPSCFGFKLAAKCPFVFGIQVVGKVPLRVWDSSCRQSFPSCLGFKLSAKCPFVFGIQVVGKVSLRVLDSSWRQSVPLCLGFKLSAKFPFVFGIQVEVCQI